MSMWPHSCPIEGEISIAKGESCSWCGYVDPNAEEGRKFDSEKPKLYLLPPKSILEIGKVLTYGAEKYDAENWRKVEDLQNRYTSAALRHIFAHIEGEELDEETGYSHLAHAMCCLLFKLEDELLAKSEKERVREADTSEHPTRHNTFEFG